MSAHVHMLRHTDDSHEDGAVPLRKVSFDTEDAQEIEMTETQNMLYPDRLINRDLTCVYGEIVYFCAIQGHSAKPLVEPSYFNMRCA